MSSKNITPSENQHPSDLATQLQQLQIIQVRIQEIEDHKRSLEGREENLMQKISYFEMKRKELAIDLIQKKEQLRAKS